MIEKKRKKSIVKTPKKTSVNLWTGNTGSKEANERAWDKAVRESNIKRPNILDPNDGNK